MIDAAALTTRLKGLVVELEDDLRVRADVDDLVAARVSEEFVRARDAERTALSEAAWREGLLTQVAVGWVLTAVFVRFCEDNGLLADPVLSGPGDRLVRAEDAQRLFLRGGAELGERDYLQHVFEEAKGLPGLDQVLSTHNPVWLFGPSEDGARLILNAFREADDETAALVWDFTDVGWGTRFLGDLYQDLSEAAKKNFALLQTPDFVESFILDRTLDPAIDEFGLDEFRMIDPACGSGHFLLGAFDRLFERWQAKAPADGVRANAAKALGSVNGVDINPFAAAIAKFRLLVAALKVSGVSTLAEAPAFELNVATGDSLLHAPVVRGDKVELAGVGAAVDVQGPAAHLFATEDGNLVREILGREYHAVVANPPYITPKDPAARVAYRDRFETCHRQYSLSVPFMELIFRLAKRGALDRPAGFTGQITANSFMKREFGSRLIEQYLADQVDLTHVVDTSGAYIPGHGTPTVILFGRNRNPVSDTVRAVMGIRGEPLTPEDPAKGQVWSSIQTLIDEPGAENTYISVDNLNRVRLSGHPWSLQGGGASELAEQVAGTRPLLEDRIAAIGRTTVVGEDDAWVMPTSADFARSWGTTSIVPFVVGEAVRDYSIDQPPFAAYPYDALGGDPVASEDLISLLWHSRTVLMNRSVFGKRVAERGEWFEHLEHYRNRLKTPLSIAFAFVATHNHFVLDRGGKVFKQSAPVIKLGEGASVEDHLELLGLLNSSVACFWMQQVFHNKGGPGGGSSKDEKWHDFYEFDGTKLKRFPVASGSVLGWAERLDSLAAELSGLLPSADESAPGPRRWAERGDAALDVRAVMQGLQEELDWRCYHLYGLTEDDLSLPADEAPSLSLGERAFEIVLARKMAAGELQTKWFSKLGATPTTVLPGHWSAEYRALVERRIALIESDRNVRLCERPETKRRWEWDDWVSLEEDALEAWLLTRLEDAALWGGVSVLSVAQLADRVRGDVELVRAAQMLVGQTDVDLVKVIGGLVAQDAVPFLAAWRYKTKGLLKRVEWEKTWDLQRREDAGEDVGVIPVPPKYGSADFVKSAYWKLRGKLDVPKERFVSYPGAERANDDTMLVGWAGWDHQQQAQALAGLVEARQTSDGWGTEQLAPLLAGLGELVPWLKQWHNDLDPATGQRLGDFYDDYLTSKCAQLQIDRSTLGDWRPPTTTRRRKKKASTT